VVCLCKNKNKNAVSQVIRFGIWTCVGPMNHMLHGGSDPLTGKDTVGGHPDMYLIFLGQWARLVFAVARRNQQHATMMRADATITAATCYHHCCCC